MIALLILLMQIAVVVPIVFQLFRTLEQNNRVVTH